MPTPDTHGTHEPHSRQEHHGEVRSDSTNYGYEVSDANVPGIIIFLASLAICAVVIFVFSFGMGKVINTHIKKVDGPLNKWNAEVMGTMTNKNLASDAVLEQEELHAVTQAFPTPRVQMDNGDQDVANLHAREDLLLDHYSWVDRKQGKVRIPIEQAMELIAKSGLPVAPQVQRPALMMGDKPIVVPVPLTNGFARTGYEQQVLEAMEQQRLRGESPSNQAALGTNH